MHIYNSVNFTLKGPVVVLSVGAGAQPWLAISHKPILFINYKWLIKTYLPILRNETLLKAMKFLFNYRTQEEN